MTNVKELEFKEMPPVYVTLFENTGFNIGDQIIFRKTNDDEYDFREDDLDEYGFGAGIYTGNIIYGYKPDINAREFGLYLLNMQKYSLNLHKWENIYKPKEEKCNNLLNIDWNNINNFGLIYVNYFTCDCNSIESRKVDNNLDMLLNEYLLEMLI